MAADLESAPTLSDLSSPPRPEPAAEIRQLAAREDTAREDTAREDTAREDTDRDGRVTPADALRVLNNLRRGGGDDAMDVDGNGRVEPSDALRVLNRLRRDRGSSPTQSPDLTEPDVDPTTPDAPPIPSDVDPTPDRRSETHDVQTFDGTGNNPANDDLGAAHTAFIRVAAPDYADGVSALAGEDRLSAREISNLVFDQQESIESTRGLTNLVWQWGQFIDHDITATAEGDVEALIAVATGDEHFDPFATGVATIGFTRSGVADGTGVDTPAQQVNEITAFLDGSMVYGSDTETADSLRSFVGGRLATSDGDLLPRDDRGFFLAGDHRVNEQHGLIAMHTLWVREHNRIADEIAAADPTLDDEAVFQRARRRVIAQIQAITFNEYLPQLIGRDAIERYEGYDPTIDPSISNLFATAAFRYGHTSLPGELARLNNDGSVAETGPVALRDAFFNPTAIVDGGIDTILKGLASTAQQEIDTHLVDDVRNFLFGPPGSGGFDLAALNIQRGRDHGLPDYNTAREAMGLERIESFADISDHVAVQDKLASAYETVDDIDVWVGMLAEDHVRGGSVGELAAAVIADQFTRLRDGDRFWYQNLVSPERAGEIGSTRLSDVIERNTGLTTIQPNGFRLTPTDRPANPPIDAPERPDGPQPDGPRPDGPRPDGPPRGPAPLGETPTPDRDRPAPPPANGDAADGEDAGDRDRPDARREPTRPALFADSVDAVLTAAF